MRNYQKELEKIIEESERAGVRPTLLLHGCCAPCSSHSLEYLSKHFDITLFFYNPNITPADEYRKRCDEAKRLTKELDASSPISFLEGGYDETVFFDAVKGLENCKEGGERCKKCFELRLFETARVAKEKGFDYFSTTLTISPLKNAELLNSVGEAQSDEFQVKWLPSDLKKKNGYLRSIELSRQYGLYRQNYCGCIFSKAESQNR